jgi:hypothetical protein
MLEGRGCGQCPENLRFGRSERRVSPGNLRQTRENTGVTRVFSGLLAAVPYVARVLPYTNDHKLFTNHAREVSVGGGRATPPQAGAGMALGALTVPVPASTVHGPGGSEAAGSSRVLKSSLAGKGFG